LGMRSGRRTDDNLFLFHHTIIRPKMAVFG
jgi:hypothetical protein